MAEQEAITPTPGEEASGETTGDDKNEVASIPYYRFNKVVKERAEATDRIAELEANLAKFNKDKQDRLDEKSKANGEFAEMADRYKTENAQLKQVNEALQNKADVVANYELEQRALLTGKLPETKQPFAANMSLTDLANFVEIEQKTQIKLPKENAPGERYGGYEDIVEFAKKDSEGYAAYRKQQGLKAIR